MQKHFQMDVLAKALSKTTRATRQWFRYHGLAKKVGGRWVVTPGKLLANWPELYFDIMGTDAKASIVAKSRHFQMDVLAKALSKTTRATRQWFRYHGLAKKVGGRWVVTAKKLLDQYPDLFFAVSGRKSSEGTT